MIEFNNTAIFGNIEEPLYNPHNNLTTNQVLRENNKKIKKLDKKFNNISKIYFNEGNIYFPIEARNSKELYIPINIIKDKPYENTFFDIENIKDRENTYDIKMYGYLYDVEDIYHTLINKDFLDNIKYIKSSNFKVNSVNIIGMFSSVNILNDICVELKRIFNTENVNVYSISMVMLNEEEIEILKQYNLQYNTFQNYTQLIILLYNNIYAIKDIKSHLIYNIFPKEAFYNIKQYIE